MRNLREAIQIHKDHVGAVIDVDYSPTGKEIVSGSYDKTLRIFQVDEGRSREVYHTKRMQRLTTVLWSSDNNYVLCGSDEMDIRIWKANASQKLGLVSFRDLVPFFSCLRATSFLRSSLSFSHRFHLFLSSIPSLSFSHRFHLSLPLSFIILFTHPPFSLSLPLLCRNRTEKKPT